MNTPPRNLPRFLPTLTEVVQPPALVRDDVAASPDADEAVRLVMQRVEKVLEQRLREETEALVRIVVNEQIQTMSARLRLELESVVRKALLDALPGSIDPPL
jgi:hypothetical protein